MGDLPRDLPGVETVSLAGRFFNTEPPGKPLILVLNKMFLVLNNKVCEPQIYTICIENKTYHQSLLSEESSLFLFQQSQLEILFPRGADHSYSFFPQRSVPHSVLVGLSQQNCSVAKAVDIQARCCLAQIDAPFLPLEELNHTFQLAS